MIETHCYKLRVKHDKGIVTITTWACDEAGAKRIVMAAERCPERAILSIKKVERKRPKSGVPASP